MISVIITTKNGENITRAIDSVLNQSLDDLEIIVVSDGSTDNTAELVRQKAMQSPTVPIKIIELKNNIGPGLARNLAILGGKNPNNGETIAPCDGKYIAIIDDDDIWINPEKLKNQKAFLDENADYSIVGSSKVFFVDEQGATVKTFIGLKDSSNIFKNMLSINPVITSSVMFPKSAFEKVGGFKNMYLCEDYDLWLRMGLVGKICNVDNAEIQYTVRKGGASGTRTLELFKTTLRIVIQNKNNYPRFFKGLIKGILRIVLFYFKNLF